MKYKLIKDGPGIKAGSIWGKQRTEYVSGNDVYDEKTVENNPEWFAPYCFTTEDGVEVYCEDKVYALVLQTYNNGQVKKDTILEFQACPTMKHWNKSCWLFFSTKQAALIYLAQQKYPVGTKVKCLFEGNISIVTNHNTFEDTIGNVWFASDNERNYVKICNNEKWAEIVPQFEVGKWYKCQSYAATYYFKCKHNKHVPEGNVIQVAGSGYKYTETGTANYNCAWEVADLTEIQDMLPNNHVDKVVSWKIGDFITNAHGKTMILDRVYFREEDIIGESPDCNEKLYLKYERKATEQEIISYYEKLGWVKGAKFNIHFALAELDHIKFSDGIVFVHSSIGQCYPIKRCTLVKEPNYPKSWEELKPKYVSMHEFDTVEDYLSEAYKNNFGYYIKNDSLIFESGQRTRLTAWDKNIFATKKQAESAFAFAQLSQLHKAMIDEYNKVNNCDWEHDWSTLINPKYCIYRYEDELEVDCRYKHYAPLVFPTEELAEFSLKHHKELWEQYHGL